MNLISIFFNSKYIPKRWKDFYYYNGWKPAMIKYIQNSGNPYAYLGLSFLEFEMDKLYEEGGWEYAIDQFGKPREIIKKEIKIYDGMEL